VAPEKRRTLLVLSVVWSALAAVAPPPVSAKDRRVSAQELVKQGFFNDFDELDLESLLEGTEAAVSIAARRSEPITAASGAATLITAEEISSGGFRTLEDVLRTLPGFDVVVDNVGRDRIIVRGLPPATRGRSEGIVILLNGHRLNEGLEGGVTALNLSIPVTGLHHIEVLRGPASALYGEGALGAVVNLVTDGDAKEREKSVFEASAGAGTFGEAQVGFEIASRMTQDIWFGGRAQFANSSGAEVMVPADAQTRRDSGSGVPPISVAPGPARDNKVRMLQTLYRVVYKDWHFLMRLKQERSDGYIGATDTLGVFKNVLDNRQLVFDARREKKYRGGRLETRFGFTQSKVNELLEVIPPGFLRDTGTGSIFKLPSIFVQTSLGVRRAEAEAVYARSFAPTHDLTAGVSLAREATYGLSAKANLDFQTFFPETGLVDIAGALDGGSRNIVGLWVQDAWRAPLQIAVTAAARLEHMGGIGAQLSPRVALVRALPRDLTARLVFARAYAAPGFRDLGFDLGGYRANPDLGAASVVSGEASLTYRRNPLQLTGTGYVSGLRDPIEPETTPSLGRPTRLVNGRGVNVRGFDLTARRTLGQHSAFLSYGLQSTRDAETGRRVADVPSHIATLGGTFVPRDHFDVTPHLMLRSARPRDPRDARPELDGYAVLNLTFRYVPPSRKLEIRGVLSNLGGAHYHDPAPYYGVPGDYPRAGRGFLFDARYRF
jgi:iron complex outermembrane receptor protein